MNHISRFCETCSLCHVNLMSYFFIMNIFLPFRPFSHHFLHPRILYSTWASINLCG